MFEAAKAAESLNSGLLGEESDHRFDPDRKGFSRRVDRLSSVNRECHRGALLVFSGPDSIGLGVTGRVQPYIKEV